MPGTAIGTAAPILTMEPLSARSPTTNAVSTRLRNRGPSFRAPGTRRVPPGPWRPSTNISCAGTTSCRCSSHRPSTILRMILAISRDTRPESARMADNIPMARFGRPSPSLMRGDGDKAGELLSMLNPIRHADSPTGVHRYKVEPYVACADVYSDAATCRTRRMDLVHRLGRMDVPRGFGMAFWDFGCRAQICCSILASRATGQDSRSSSDIVQRAMKSR